MPAPPRRTVAWSFLGRVPYAESEALQDRVRSALAAGAGPEHLLLLEHPHVFTLGRSASAADILSPRAWLEAQGVEVHESDRGGQVTYHGPGQLVGYPIVDLDPDRRDLHRYMRDLQEVLIRTLGAFGLEAHRREGKEHVGVWVGERKVASLGVHVKRWITTHGFALNVSTDLSYFRRIVPCGLPEVEMASIRSLTGQAPPLPEVAEAVAGHFAEVFDRELVRVGAAGLPGPAERGAGTSFPAAPAAVTGGPPAGTGP